MYKKKHTFLIKIYIVSVNFLKSCHVYFDELNMKLYRTKYDRTVSIINANKISY